MATKYSQRPATLQEQVDLVREVIHKTFPKLSKIKDDTHIFHDHYMDSLETAEAILILNAIFKPMVNLRYRDLNNFRMDTINGIAELLMRKER